MSLPELLNTNINSKPWSDLYCESLTTNHFTNNGGGVINGNLTIDGQLILQESTNQILFNTTNSTTLSAPNPAAPRTLIIPDSGVSTSDIVVSSDTSVFNQSNSRLVADSNNTIFGNGAGVLIPANSSTTLANTLIGINSGNALTDVNTADYNTAVGANTLSLLANAEYNTVVGNEAGQNTLGAQNTFCGALCGTGSFSGATGTNNTAIGYSSMSGYIGGSFNTCLGNFAGHNIQGSTGCVLIGSNSDVDSDPITNSISIGNGAIVSASNSCIIGNQQLTDISSGSTGCSLGNSNPFTTISFFTGTYEATASVLLSSSQILNLSTIPVTIIPAQGVNKIILITTNIFFNLQFNSVAYSGTATINLKCNGITYATTGQSFSGLNSSSSNITIFNNSIFSDPLTTLSNQPLTLSASTAITSGNSSLLIVFKYMVVSCN